MYGRLAMAWNKELVDFFRTRAVTGIHRVTRESLGLEGEE
jgi:hypothetical protein